MVDGWRVQSLDEQHKGKHENARQDRREHDETKAEVAARSDKSELEVLVDGVVVVVAIHRDGEDALFHVDVLGCHIERGSDALDSCGVDVDSDRLAEVTEFAFDLGAHKQGGRDFSGL